MFDKQTIKDVNLKNQTVLVRTDYNVPLSDGEITDDLRIRASLPTLEYLTSHGAKKVIIISHLGRPEGKDRALSLKPVAARLAELLPEKTVNFVDDVSGPDVEAAVNQLPKGGLLVLENLRFYRGEENNSRDFAQEIAESTHADLFVQDGFAVLHRAHASTEAITHELPAVAGLLVEKEISALSKLLDNPRHPFWLILGGAKVEDKEPLIDALSSKVNEAFVGGKIAADGYTPTREAVHVATEFKTDENGNKLDLSDNAADTLVEYINNEAKTVLWNGTLGKTEDPAFAAGSTKVALALGEKTAKDSTFTSIICGGDTTGFVNSVLKEHPELKFTLISTGGGASLKFLTGTDLPGLDALESK